MNSSSTASQPASQHKRARARHCDDLPRPAFKVHQFRLPGEATPHRNQPYYYCLFCPAFCLCPDLIENPSGQFNVDVCLSGCLFVLREFPEQLSSAVFLPAHHRTRDKISMPPCLYARETRDTMLPLPDKTRDPCSRPSSSARSLSFARAVTLPTKRRSNHESCIHPFPFPFLLHTPVVARCVNGDPNCATICLLACACISFLSMREKTPVVDHLL